MSKLTENQETILLFAARYSFNRDTYAGRVVVDQILSEWPNLSDYLKDKIVSESSREALYNRDQWVKIAYLYNQDRREKLADFI